MKAVAYYRVSSDLQDHSLTMQRNMAILAAVKNDVVIEDEYDEGVCSARKVPFDDRTHLQRLIKDIRAGYVTHVLVYKRDRLARKSHEYMKIYRLFKEYNVEVIFTADNEFPIHYDGVGDYIELIMSGLVEREGDLISRRIRDTKIANFLNGTLLGNLPYGYSAVNKENKQRIHLHESELNIVREIFEMVRSGKYDSLNDVRKELINKGYTRKYENKGKHHAIGDNREWTIIDIEHVLKSTLYYGKHQMQFSGLEEPLTYARPEAKIMEFSVWQQAQEALKRMKPVLSQETEAEVPINFYAEGLLYCGLCQQPLITKIRHPKAVKTGFYECVKHDLRVEERAIEDLLLRRAEETFRSLIDSDLEKLVERHRKNNEEELRHLLRKREADLQEAKTTLLKSTELYVKSNDQIQRQKRLKTILEKYAAYSEINKSCESLVHLLEKLDEVADLPRYLHREVLSQLHQEVRTEENIKPLLKDVISQVKVFEEGIEITIKHPFLHLSEVLTNVTA